MTVAEIREAGIAALTKAMGPVGAIRFLRECHVGRGNYTARRRAILGNPPLEKVLRAMDASKKSPAKRRAPRTR